MYKKSFNIILFCFFLFIKLYPYDFDFDPNRYLNDSILPDPFTILKPVYDLNEITVQNNNFFSFYSKHYETDLIYDFFIYANLKDSLKFSLNYKNNFKLKGYPSYLALKTDVTNKNLLQQLITLNLQNSFNHFKLKIEPSIFIYPAILTLTNNSNFMIIFKEKYLFNSFYQNIFSYQKNHLGFSFLNEKIDVGLFYYKIVLPSFQYKDSLSLFTYRFLLDFFRTPKDTFGIFSRSRNDIQSMMPVNYYNFLMEIKNKNYKFYISLNKDIDSIKNYTQIFEKNFYFDFAALFFLEKKNFKYSFSFNLFKTDSIKTYYKIFTQNRFKNFILINDLQYFPSTRSIIYSPSFALNEGDIFITLGVGNMFSQKNLFYSNYDTLTLFYRITFTGISFLY